MVVTVKAFKETITELQLKHGNLEVGGGQGRKKLAEIYLFIYLLFIFVYLLRRDLTV